jgi:ubiquitin-small subunit ribosomal protein S27Ae
MPKGKSVKKGKKPHKNKPTSKKYTKYKIKGDKISRNARFCVKCGPGVFMAKSNGKSYCGKCHYTEFESKSKDSEAKPETVEVEAKK